MNQLSDRPMSLVSVEFEELYQRHLCRHSQFGINLIHIAVWFGIWYSVYGIMYWLIPSSWMMVVLGVSFLMLVAPNLPISLLVMTTIFLVGVCTLVYYASLPWVWVYLLLILVLYKLQLWSHKLYKLENDMTQFNQKYPPGKLLFFVLLLYDVPIILKYLVFGKEDWR